MQSDRPIREETYKWGQEQEVEICELSKALFNLGNCSYFIFSYNFSKDRDVFLVISLGICIPESQDFSTDEPGSPSLN